MRRRCQLSITLLFLGQPEAALPHFEKRLQIDPHWQNVFFAYFWLGYCHLLLSHTDEAIDLERKSSAANPRMFGAHWALAAALGLKGDVDEARAALAESRKLKPEYSSFAQMRANAPNWDASPQFVALREKTVDVGLRRAGFPDE